MDHNATRTFFVTLLTMINLTMMHLIFVESQRAVKRKFACTVINVYLENLSYLKKQNFNMYIK